MAIKFQAKKLAPKKMHFDMACLKTIISERLFSIFPFDMTSGYNLTHLLLHGYW